MLRRRRLDREEGEALGLEHVPVRAHAPHRPRRGQSDSGAARFPSGQSGRQQRPEVPGSLSVSPGKQCQATTTDSSDRGARRPKAAALTAAAAAAARSAGHARNRSQAPARCFCLSQRTSRRRATPMPTCRPTQPAQRARLSQPEFGPRTLGSRVTRERQTAPGTRRLLRSNDKHSPPLGPDLRAYRPGHRYHPPPPGQTHLIPSRREYLQEEQLVPASFEAPVLDADFGALHVA